MMTISFQEQRSDGNRRWTDHLKLKRIRFAELIEMMHGVDALDRHELLEARALINRKLEAFGKAEQI